MNDLERFFNQHDGRLIHKWKHYFEIYERHFARFRGGPVNIVEFGVSQGGSIQMWRHYFGAGAKVFGVDINRTASSSRRRACRSGTCTALVDT